MSVVGNLRKYWSDPENSLTESNTIQKWHRPYIVIIEQKIHLKILIFVNQVEVKLPVHAKRSGHGSASIEYCQWNLDRDFSFIILDVACHR